MKRLYEKGDVGVVGFPDGTIYINTYAQRFVYPWAGSHKQRTERGRTGEMMGYVSTSTELNLASGKKVHTFYIQK